jgi:hypothetical protein
MSLSANKNTRRKQVSPVAAAIAGVALIAFVIWRGWVAFAPIPTGPLPPAPTQDINFLKQKAQECQGDFNKLSLEDQTKVQQIAHGYGPAAMASNWRHLSNKSQ